MTRWKHVGIVLAATLSLALVGCGKDGAGDGAGKKGADDKAAASAKSTPKVELAPLDITAALTKAGRSAKTKVTVMAPKGAKASESYGDVEVVAGKTFALVVTPKAQDLAKDKAYHKKNTMQKHKGFVVDGADGFISKAELAGKTSHFMTANKKVGSETLGCKSLRGAV